MLQSSHVLARLPNLVKIQHIKPLAADVHALTEGKKKKRPEIALAVDFEGIRLYDVCISAYCTSVFN